MSQCFCLFVYYRYLLDLTQLNWGEDITNRYTWCKQMTRDVLREIYGGFLKWWYPQIIHFNRVFHYFHHPFWGTPIFGNTHIYVYIYMIYQYPPIGEQLSFRTTSSFFTPVLGRWFFPRLAESRCNGPPQAVPCHVGDGATCYESHQEFATHHGGISSATRHHCRDITGSGEKDHDTREGRSKGIAGSQLWDGWYGWDFLF